MRVAFTARINSNRRIVFGVLAILLGLVAGVCAAHATQGGTIGAALSAHMRDAAANVPFQLPGAGLHRTLNTIYAPDPQPLWSVNGQATSQSLALIDILKHVEIYGLERREYHGAALAKLLRRAQSAPALSRHWAQLWAQFDVEMSTQALHLIRDLHYGRIDPREVDGLHPSQRRVLEFGRIVRSLARSENPTRILASIEPAFRPYWRLKRALAVYLRLASQEPELTALPPLPHRSVKPGGAYRGATALRRLLRAVGDLSVSGDVALRSSLGAHLVGALERYQRRHGLAADGVLGANTFRELTTPFAVRVRQIELTLERWRWLPAIHSPVIIVNIPQFRLLAFRGGDDLARSAVQMDVIVGRKLRRNRTPGFIGVMTDVVFRPFWNVPRSITVRELLPDIRIKRGVLAAQHLELVRGDDDASSPLPATAQNLAALAAGQLRLRQQPGPTNSLGLIKFEVPNRYDVLLHATPARRLFNATDRAFSHGCIRVSNPVALAAFVLRSTPGNWTVMKIEAATNDTDNRRVALATPIRVMVVYHTVVVTGGGEVRFAHDVYGRDRRLAHLLRFPNVARHSPAVQPPSTR